ncbi:thioredoxin-like protein [Ascodesmis nigricans]|uniref:Thioredoxin-like protein n=1 Tax=Ascodesmis nigricans TaxID=341454 RepID=A0A4S2MX24_9PEZI|nr:thioredoxin-like protein [Ascodesmis nigricans]
MSFIAPLRSAFRPHCARFVVSRPAISRPVVRSFSTSPSLLRKFPEQPRLRIGCVAPNFTAKTTRGPIDFHEYIGDSWVILFSHPADFTPVCTTELGAFAKLEPEFTKRNVRLIGLSANDIDSHAEWEKDIDEVTGSAMTSGGGFPIIADEKREVAFMYDMVDQQQVEQYMSGTLPLTIRSVFIIDPKKTIRLIMTYPASTGRNTSEVLRCVDALQLADGKGIATPVDWIKGGDVIVPPSVSTKDAQEKFGKGNVEEVKRYLRWVKNVE